jgi:hypothetical protein
MCRSPLQHGLRQATHNTLGLGSWSTVSCLFRDRPATRTGPRLSATRRRARWPLKPREAQVMFYVQLIQLVTLRAQTMVL